MASFTVKRGDTWRQPFTWRQGSETGDPVDLTGCTAALQVRDAAGELVLDATLDLTIDGPNGTITVDTQIPEDLEPGKYLFDIEMTYSDGFRQSTDTQYLKVVADITRDE